MPLILMKGLMPHLQFNVKWREGGGGPSSLSRLNRNGKLKGSIPLASTCFHCWVISHCGCKQSQKYIDVGIKENVTHLRKSILSCDLVVDTLSENVFCWQKSEGHIRLQLREYVLWAFWEEAHRKLLKDASLCFKQWFELLKYEHLFSPLCPHLCVSSGGSDKKSQIQSKKCFRTRRWHLRF